MAMKRKRHTAEVGSDANEEGEERAPPPSTNAAAGSATSVGGGKTSAGERKTPKLIPGHKVGRDVIYSRWSGGYDELMKYHDCSQVVHELRKIMDSLRCGVEGERLSIMDLGCGTGRVFRLLLAGSDALLGRCYAYDRSQHMIERCVSNMEAFAGMGKVRCGVGAEALPPQSSEPEPSTTTQRPLEITCGVLSFEDVLSGRLQAHPHVNVVVCAWSLSSLMNSMWGDVKWHEPVAHVLQEMHRVLDPSPPGAVVVIESLGSDCQEPKRASTLHAFLEEQGGFIRTCVRTDYRFPSLDVGKQLMTFFFGEPFAHKVSSRKEFIDTNVLCECTGVWVRRYQENSLLNCVTVSSIREFSARRDGRTFIYV